MYIRRKVFSTVIDENGEERYFSTNEIINEEDYLNEVMYSEPSNEELVKDLNNRKYKRNNTVGYGVAGAGLGVIGGTAAALRGKNQKKITEAVTKEMMSANPSGQRMSKLANMAVKNAGMGALKGAAIGTAALGTLGYLRGRYKAKKREDRRTAVLNRMQ